MADNQGGEFGAGLSLVNSQVTIVNSILWGNQPKQVTTNGGDSASVRYSLGVGGWPGLGNLAADPLFAGRGRWVDRTNPSVTASPDDPAATWVAGDYHLQSRAGRWEPKTGTWLQDVLTSPCIDAGDPASPIGQEPPPNGRVIDMGAYGGTVEASMSLAGTLSGGNYVVK
jgi:hypothetical protein